MDLYVDLYACTLLDTSLDPTTSSYTWYVSHKHANYEPTTSSFFQVLPGTVVVSIRFMCHATAPSKLMSVAAFINAPLITNSVRSIQTSPN